MHSSSVMDITDRHLKVEDINGASEGEYICVTTNAGGINISNQAFVRVLKPGKHIIIRVKSCPSNTAIPYNDHRNLFLFMWKSLFVCYSLLSIPICPKYLVPWHFQRCVYISMLLIHPQ